VDFTNKYDTGKIVAKKSSEEFELVINFKDGLLKTHRGKYQFCMPWSN
jgi:hypothetical protein